jgi:hypothetical protein
MVRVFPYLSAGDFEPYRRIQLALERRDVAVRCPQLQLRITAGTEPGQVIVAAREKIDPRDGLRVAAIESFRQPDHRRQHPDDAAQRAVQIAISVVRFLRRGLPMVSRNQRDHFDLLGFEAA